MAITQRVPTIRPFRWQQHGRQVLQFQYEVYEGNFPGFVVDAGFLADYERQLREAVKNPYEEIWVIEEPGTVVGFIWAALITTLVDERLGYIKNLYVRPERRGEGYGRQLMAQAEAWMQAQGITKSALDVTLTNKAALRLYQRCGYQPRRYRMEKDLRGSEQEAQR